MVKSSKHVLEPHERIAEVLFGLIMVLTFTGSLSVAQADRKDVRTMLIGALGCNLAWGIIDGVLYLMGCLAEKGRSLAILRALRKNESPQRAQKLLADSLPSHIASVLQPAEYAAIDQRLKQMPDPAERAHLSKADWVGAIAVFLLVFLCTFPVALPFMVMSRANSALRVSNAIAVAMLFLAGMAYGRCVGRRSWVTGVAMVILGLILAGLTMLLGG